MEKWALEPTSNVGKVLAVMSGKGGVGKSFVTSLFATHAAKLGYRVGILDCDLTGPSIPAMFGLEEKAQGTAEHLYPAYSRENIAIMSINLLLPHATDPVIWRGPILNQLLRDFWTKIHWGTLDLLLLDMPPGTGDVPLTVFQHFSLDGVLEVTTPSEMASIAVEKAFHMADRMAMPLHGEIVNMAYFVCPDCGSKHRLFGEAKEKSHIRCLGELPLRLDAGQAVDTGHIEDVDMQEMTDIVLEECRRLGLGKGI